MYLRKRFVKLKLYYLFFFMRLLCVLFYVKFIKKDCIRFKYYFYLLICFEFD